MFVSTNEMINQMDTRYKNSKVIIKAKHGSGFDYLEKYPFYFKEIDYIISENRNTYFIVTDLKKIKKIGEKFPEDLFDIKIEEHPEFA